MEFNSIDELVEDLRQGKIVVILDNEDRENEGDVICAAEFATTENVNFMAKYARGLICMPMSKEYVERLSLPQMVTSNTDNHETATNQVGEEHPDRDAQFNHINEKVKTFGAAEYPVISIDCKKKELVGNFQNVGQEYAPKKNPLNPLLPKTLTRAKSLTPPVTLSACSRLA